MLTMPDSIALFGVFMTVAVSVWKFVPKKSNEVATWREVKQLRESLEQQLSLFGDRLDCIERDMRRVAVHLGLDLWGS